MSSTIVQTIPVWSYRLKHENSIFSDNQFNTRFTENIDGHTNSCGSRSAMQGTSGGSPSLCSTKLQSDPTFCSTKQFGGEPQTKFTRFILRLREPVADYLERHGLPKNSQCSFVSLVTSLVQRSYAAGVTILMMLVNLFPLLDGFVYLIRFLLDKILEIANTRDTTEIILKSLLFVGELVILFLLVMFIFGLILMPVWALLGYVLSKCMGIATQVG